MDQLIVVTYPEPLPIEARTMDHESVPDGNVGLAYFYDQHMIARGAVDPDAIESINTLLRKPVVVAIAATEDDDGNIEGRVCLVLPVEGEIGDRDDEPDEPWKESIPGPPPEVESSYTGSAAAPGAEGQGEKPKMALLPIGNVVRGVRDRNHPDDVAADASEMLHNLLSGRAKDAVQKAIDDLLDSL